MLMNRYYISLNHDLLVQSGELNEHETRDAVIIFPLFREISR
jgi:hypothetical protein